MCVDGMSFHMIVDGEMRLNALRHKQKLRDTTNLHCGIS